MNNIEISPRETCKIVVDLGLLRPSQYNQKMEFSRKDSIRKTFRRKTLLLPIGKPVKTSWKPEHKREQSFTPDEKTISEE